MLSLLFSFFYPPVLCGWDGLAVERAWEPSNSPPYETSENRCIKAHQSASVVEKELQYTEFSWIDFNLKMGNIYRNYHKNCKWQLIWNFIYNKILLKRSVLGGQKKSLLGYLTKSSLSFVWSVYIRLYCRKGHISWILFKKVEWNRQRTVGILILNLVNERKLLFALSGTFVQAKTKSI